MLIEELVAYLGLLQITQIWVPGRGFSRYARYHLIGIRRTEFLTVNWLLSSKKQLKSSGGIVAAFFMPRPPPIGFPVLAGWGWPWHNPDRYIFMETIIS
jgi:hypothetical protein